MTTSGAPATHSPADASLSLPGHPGIAGGRRHTGRVGSIVGTSRRSWHGVAELLLAGPQYRQSQTIRLRITPGGFATVTEPDLRVEGTTLVIEGERVAMPGHTCAGLSVLTGAPAGGPADLYKDGSGVDPDEALHFDDDAIAVLAGAFELGDTALRAFAPDQTPVLWPEHFDVGISVGEVNYGISPGDGYLDEPYAYVGPLAAPGGGVLERSVRRRPPDRRVVRCGRCGGVPGRGARPRGRH